MSGIPMPLSVDVDGIRYHAFDVYYRADDKTGSFYIYALNREHASYLVSDIRKTATLAPGNIIEVSNADKHD